LYLAGGIVFYASVFFSPPEAGWTAYTPLSSGPYIPGNGTDAWIFLIHLTGVSSILGALNVTVTIANMRARGMGWGRLPLFCWSMLAQAIMILLTLPVIAGAVTILLTDRHFGTCFYDPTCGGSSLLWQHLFWFFGHPEVYIMILPGFGMISEIIPVFSRKPIFGYSSMVAALFGIVFLSMAVWAHHMFTVGMNIYVETFFMVMTMLIAIPTGIKFFNWIATAWSGSIDFKLPMKFAFGFLATFLIGGITGVYLSSVPVDTQLHQSYYVVAHLHYVLFGGAVFTILAGLYYWFPKITGRLLNEKLGEWNFWTLFIGFNGTFLVMHTLGLEGMPRRIATYPGGFGEEGWGTVNVIITISSFLLAFSVLLFLINVIWSNRHGHLAGDDPWEGNSLEWATTSPPPPYNFEVVPPVRTFMPMREVRAARLARRGALEPDPAHAPTPESAH
jgi:heme/copper-type cytochrome/quinol oxidase subunit 1